MPNNLFKPVSPLIGWFILMELVTTLYLIGYWTEYFRHGLRPWEHGELGPLVTGLFIVSNGLLFRHRRWAVAGFVLCWLVLALALLPTT
ncbi:MAG: hypothetical protein WAO02_02595 [Verrucomicrobiia bacterium]